MLWFIWCAQPKFANCWISKLCKVFFRALLCFVEMVRCMRTENEPYDEISLWILFFVKLFHDQLSGYKNITSQRKNKKTKKKLITPCHREAFAECTILIITGWFINISWDFQFSFIYVVLTFCQPRNKHPIITWKCLKTPYPGSQYAAVCRWHMWSVIHRL